MADCLKRIYLLGIPLDIVPEECIPEVIEDLYRLENHKQIILLDFHDFMNARLSRERKKALQEAALVLPASAILTGAVKFLKLGNAVPVKPYPFVIKLLTILEKSGKSVYLIGSDMKGVRKAEASVRKTFPGLQIVGRYSSRYKKNRENDIVTAIKKASPALLLTGKGLKGRYMWIHRKKRNFSPGLSLWEKTWFKVFSGKKNKPGYNRISLLVKSFFKTLIRPWRFFLIFRYMFFYILVLVEKIFFSGKRNI